MDEFLITLYSNFFKDFTKPYFVILNDIHGELEKQIFHYFDRKIGNTEKQDFLFNNLTIIWKMYQSNGRLGEAQQFWKDILDIIIKWEKSRNSRVHKGSLFYFWSQTAILQGELDKGFFLIHSAYEEDVITFQNELPDTPAFKTVSLNFTDPNNLLYELVQIWANFLEIFINSYNSRNQRNFSINEFQRKFLSKPPSRDTLFTFTYSLAKIYSFVKFPEEIKSGSFVNLYVASSLFSLIQVIDSLIYKSIKNPGSNDWGFKFLAKKLLLDAKIIANDSIANQHLSDINDQKNIDFEKTINDLLDQRFRSQRDNNNLCLGLESDIGIVYCLRNYTAHNLDSFPVIRQRYQEISQSIFNVLLLGIEIFG